MTLGWAYAMVVVRGCESEVVCRPCLGAAVSRRNV